MSMETVLELATLCDAERCLAVLESGKAFQLEQGFEQWSRNYPNMDTVLGDIAEKRGFVLRVDGVVAAYMCIDFNGEPVYDDIDGEWHSNQPYAVVHRMGIGGEFRGKGLASVTFALIEELCLARGVQYIRIDTHEPNKRMQHVLEKNGYVYCGTIYYQAGERMAYDKIIE